MKNEDRPYASFYILAIAMFALSISNLEIFTVKACMILTLTFRMGQDHMPNERPHVTSYVLTIAIFAL